MANFEKEKDKLVELNLYVKIKPSEWEIEEYLIEELARNYMIKIMSKVGLSSDASMRSYDFSRYLYDKSVHSGYADIDEWTFSRIVSEEASKIIGKHHVADSERSKLEKINMKKCLKKFIENLYIKKVVYPYNYAGVYGAYKVEDKKLEEISKKLAKLAKIAGNQTLAEEFLSGKRYLPLSEEDEYWIKYYNNPKFKEQEDKKRTEFWKNKKIDEPEEEIAKIIRVLNINDYYENTSDSRRLD